MTTTAERHAVIRAGLDAATRRAFVETLGAAGVDPDVAATWGDGLSSARQAEVVRSEGLMVLAFDLYGMDAKAGAPWLALGYVASEASNLAAFGRTPDDLADLIAYGKDHGPYLRVEQAEADAFILLSSGMPVDLCRDVITANVNAVWAAETYADADERGRPEAALLVLRMMLPGATA